MNKKESLRIQTTFSGRVEKIILIWLAERQPSWMTSDIMTLTGFIGSVIIAAGYILYDVNYNFLWLASFGFVVNWYGDSMDGTIARVNNQQRPVYGYYLDHTVDVINEFIMFLGLGISSLLNMNLALLFFIVYLMLTINVCLNAHLRGEFKLAYGVLGPTEFRMIVILVNTMFVLIRSLRETIYSVVIRGHEFDVTIFDCVAIGLFLLLIGIYFVTVIKDIRTFSRLDPMPRKNNQ